MSKRFRYKIAVGDPAGRRSSTWLVWFGPADIYLAAKTVAGTWKFTAHYPRPPRFPEAMRYVGFTSEHAKKTNPGDRPSLKRRKQIESSFHAIEPDVWLEALVLIPEEELREFTGDTKDIIWLPTPSAGRVLRLLIVSTPLLYNGQRLLGGPNAPALALEAPLERCGRRAWVLYQEIDTHAGELPALRAKLLGAWPKLTKPGLRGRGTRAMFCGKVSDAVAVMCEVAADAL